MRRRVVLAGLTAFLILMLVISSCGTLDMTLHTTVKTSGDIIQEVRFEGSGLMATVLEEADFTENFEEGGWEVDTERTDDSVALVATKTLSRDETILIPEMESGEPTALGRVILRSEDGLLTKSYFFELDVPGGEEETGDANGELGELVGMMLEGMFNISWTITLPGKIVESNADTIEGGSATWNFDINSLTSGRYLMVHSQYTNWPVIGGIIAGVVVVLALAVFFIIRRRRRAPASFPSEVAG